MTQPPTFLPVSRVREIAGRESSKALPDEDAETLPVPVKRENETPLLVMYYSELGPPAQRVVHPPHYAMYIDGVSGKVIQFGPASAQSLGIVDPQLPVPGVGPLNPSVDDFIAKRERLYAISPELWQAFAVGTPATEATVQPLANEYWALFTQITSPTVAPFYVQAAADFFAWLRTAAPTP